MHVIGHHDRGMELDSLSVAVHAVLKNDVAGICRERISGQPAESHEDCPVGFLVMRQAAPVVVVVGQRRRFGHRLFKPRALVAVCDGWTIDLVAGLVWSGHSCPLPLTLFLLLVLLFNNESTELAAVDLAGDQPLSMTRA